MMYCGDAIGRAQLGNKNAYCQGNPTSWLDWNLQPQDRDLLEIVQRMINCARAIPYPVAGVFSSAAPSRCKCKRCAVAHPGGMRRAPGHVSLRSGTGQDR